MRFLLFIILSVSFLCASEEDLKKKLKAEVLSLRLQMRADGKEKSIELHKYEEEKKVLSNK